MSRGERLHDIPVEGEMVRACEGVMRFYGLSAEGEMVRGEQVLTYRPSDSQTNRLTMTRLNHQRHSLCRYMLLFP